MNQTRNSLLVPLVGFLAADALGRLLRERPGNVVVLSGRNRDKIEAIRSAVHAGLHVLADKPWIIMPEDLPKLEEVLATAKARDLVALDIMTERHEVTSILQRELIADLDIFGEIIPGSADEPGVVMQSVHYLLKRVAGVPNRRPAWFFDIHQQGEGLTDVGTHLVDLVMWMVFPDQPIDYRHEVDVLSARRWPTAVHRSDFEAITGESDFPAFLSLSPEGHLNYFCNNVVEFTVRGIRTRLDIRWDLKSSNGAGDTHFAAFHGSRSLVEVVQGAEENYRPELYVRPNLSGGLDVGQALQEKVAGLQKRFPGIALEDRKQRLKVVIPDVYRVGHEAHFA